MRSKPLRSLFSKISGSPLPGAVLVTLLLCFGLAYPTLAASQTVAPVGHFVERSPDALRETAPPLSIFYSGGDDAVKNALLLAPSGTFSLVQDPAQADLFVLNGTATDLQPILARLKAGAGLLLIAGPGLDQAAISALTGVPLSLSSRSDPASLTGSSPNDSAPSLQPQRSASQREAPMSLGVGPSEPLLDSSQIVWNGAPQVRERAVITCIAPCQASVQPLVVSYEDGGWLLWKANPNTFILNAYLSGQANPQIQEWGYFNYLVYHLAMRAGGRTPLPFADYPASPVPHQTEQTALLALMALMVLTSFGIFYLVRRYSLAHPELLDHILLPGEHAAAAEKQASGWQQVGFHRPLGGFLVALTVGLIFFIPLIIYQNLILPVYILPSAQAIGTWERVKQFFNLAWMFFDMGTSIAFIKYLSEYRVHDPKKGIQYGQVFIWWQMLSGAVQVAIVISLASTLAPRSAYALYAWSIILHAFIQVPGFYQVYRHALTGFQRLDFSRLLDIGVNVLLPMTVQPIFVGVMYAWGRANPSFGGAFGGLLGLGLAAYAAELTSFLWGMWLYRRAGYQGRILFLAHFDWEIIKSSFKFGVFEMLGSAAWSFGQAAEIAITQSRLINYAEIWGNWGMAQNFIFAFNVTQTLNDGVMPAISEAISTGKKALSQYYATMAYKYNGLGSAFIGAVLMAVAPKFIIGASGPEFQRAALYVVPLIIWGAFQYPSWVGDNIQLGTNKPYIKSILVFAEQVIRVVLAWALLERFQVTALIIAYFIGLFSKGIAAYVINHKVCFPQRFYAWQSLAVPLLSAGAHYLVLNWFSNAVWKGDQLSSVLIFFVGILPSFPLFMFFYGLFGGWDTDTLAELKQAVELTGPVRRLTYWGIYQPTALAARLSPLTGRFPISIRPQAMLEAADLTVEKVHLD